MSPKSPTAAPTLIAGLGYGGLIPFITSALAVHLDSAHALFWHHALIAYGACIVSFLGALHWGFAMALPVIDSQRRNALFVWSVIPALFAWIVLLLPDRGALPVLVLSLGALLWTDRRWAGELGLPAWYLPLRQKLSLVAAACLIGTAIF